MLNKLKFKLLGWLLGDICEKAGGDYTCDKCYLRVGEGEYGPCGQNDIFRQAVRSWRLKDYYECWNVTEE